MTDESMPGASPTKPSAPTTDARAEAPEPEWISHVLTGLAAALVSVVGGGSFTLVVFAFFANAAPRRIPPIPPLLGMLVGGGVVAGLAWGIAGALGASGRPARGVLALGLGGALAVLAARYAHELGIDPVAASHAFVAIGLQGLVPDALFGFGGGLALAAPLLLVRAWRLRSPAQAAAQAVGLVSFAAGVIAWPWRVGEYGDRRTPELAWTLLDLVDSTTTYTVHNDVVVSLALVFWCVQALAFPIALDLVEPRVRRLLVAAGLEPEEPRPTHPGASPRRRWLAALALLLVLGEVAVGLAARPLDRSVVWLDRAWERRGLRAKAESGDSAAMVELADRLGQEGDPEGLEWLGRAAGLGNVLAIEALANATLNGGFYELGVPPDRVAALELLSLARDRGGSFARYAFARIAAETPDLPRARAWRDAELARLENGALTGQGSAILALGQFHEASGDRVAALRAYTRGAEAGDVDCTLALAEYLASLGKPREAAEWLERAAALSGPAAPAAATRRDELADQGLLGADATAPAGSATPAGAR